MSDHLLRRGYDDGRRTFGPLGLLFPDYATAVRARLAARARRTPGTDPGTLLAHTHLADLFLVVACERRIAGAWELLCERFPGRIAGLLRHSGASPTEAREHGDSLPGYLFCRPENGRESRLSGYDGSGSLLGWLAVIATRRLLRARRDDRQISSRDLGEPADPERSGAPDAGLLADGELSEQFLVALRRAWEELSNRQRLVLLYKYAYALQQHRIADLLDVGPPRVSRILHGALALLRKGLRRDFAADGWERLGILWPRLRDRIGELLATSGEAGHEPAECPQPKPASPSSRAPEPRR